MKLIEPEHPKISIIRQCELIDINRSTLYYEEKPETPENISLMRRIDELYTKFPYYGSPRITAQLKREGLAINHKRIERLMRVMGLEALYPKPNTSKSRPLHPKYPYLLNGLDINHPNQVWGTDITYIRAEDSWFYLVAILDWFSRYVLSWQLSPSLNVEFCLAALNDALAISSPEIHNSDQGSQFTDKDYIVILQQNKILISMDSRGRCFDNIFTERLWRTVKYEEVYLHDYRSYEEAHASLAKYFTTYNTERLHQALNYQTPAEVYFRKTKNKNQKLKILKHHKNHTLSLSKLSTIAV
jgi:putative transposase